MVSVVMMVSMMMTFVMVVALRSVVTPVLATLTPFTVLPFILFAIRHVPRHRTCGLGGLPERFRCRSQRFAQLPDITHSFVPRLDGLHEEATGGGGGETTTAFTVGGGGGDTTAGGGGDTTAGGGEMTAGGGETTTGGGVATGGGGEPPGGGATGCPQGHGHAVGYGGYGG